MINKALIEIPPKFADMPPVNPHDRKGTVASTGWRGAAGLAVDVRYYSEWMRDKAWERIGHLYPKVKVSREMLEQHPELHRQGFNSGDELTVIAWLWARTVKCPNPVCGIYTPLLASFVVSSKKGRGRSLVPKVNNKKISFLVEETPPEEFGDRRNGLKRGISAVF